MTENEIGKIIVDCALTVHRELGPGLLESVYEVILAYELQQRGFNVQRQVPVAIEYRGMKFDGVPGRHCGRRQGDYRAKVR
jgi:GxxExxY protein